MRPWELRASASGKIVFPLSWRGGSVFAAIHLNIHPSLYLSIYLSVRPPARRPPAPPPYRIEVLGANISVNLLTSAEVKMGRVTDGLTK